MLAVLALLVYMGLALVARSVVHRRRTGSSGIRVDRTTGLGRVASAVMTGGHLLVVAGAVLAIGDGGTGWALVVGTGVFVAGLALVLWAQAVMGESWRVGVDPAERTTLVTNGPFRVVRNPIFVGMALCLTGSALLAASTVAIVGVVVFVAGVEIQVRWVEEPYLRDVQGRPFDDYMRRTGRFLPGVGHLPARMSH